MNQEQKNIIIETIKRSHFLYREFEFYLKQQELNINFVLYEDEPRYFNEVWFDFVRFLK